MLEELRTFRATSIVNLKRRQIVLGGFPWLLMSEQMLPSPLSCIFEKPVLRLKVNEELASVNRRHRTTTSETVFKHVEEVIIQYVKQNLLRYVTTNDGKNTPEAEKGIVGQIHRM